MIKIQLVGAVEYTDCISRGKNPVAVTDLFSLVNQCPLQGIQPHTDQSVGRAH